MGILIRGGALVAALLCGGCFDPDERDGAIACSASMQCPPDFECDQRDGLCYRELPPPGRPDASRVVDAAVIFDAVAADAPAPDANLLPACSDGEDNDCDGRIDVGVDPGCSSGEDDDEHGTTECDDGIDNDDDGDTDFQIASPSCTEPRDSNCNSSFDDNEN